MAHKKLSNNILYFSSILKNKMFSNRSLKATSSKKSKCNVKGKKKCSQIKGGASRAISAALRLGAVAVANIGAKETARLITSSFYKT